jgi:hypothetical protein
MNVKVVIELDGSADEVEKWLARLAPLSTAPQFTQKREDGTREWTPELMDQFVNRISDKARDALWVMAKHAPQVSFEEIQDELDVDGRSLGGILASFGFAERAGLPRPYKVDKAARRYFIDPGVAKLAIAALDGDG